MKRLLADLFGVGLFFALMWLLPINASIIVGLAIPFVAGFARGYVERRYLRPIPHWVGAVEWGCIVLLTDMIMCIPNPKTDPNTNYWTIFGAFFLIFIIPSVLLSVAAFMAAVTGKRIGLLRE